MPVRIKICGVTSLSDARFAVDQGADALGFVFYSSSPRYLPVAAAAQISRGLPPFVARVGLFVDATIEHIRDVISACNLDTIQLHGDEPPEYCRHFAGVAKVIKAFRVRDAQSLDLMTRYETDAWLLDSYVPGKRGGTGHTFNWGLAMEAKMLGRPIILSGGLDPVNVTEAIRRVRPYAVDVSSGVESEPGRKDPTRVQAFIQAVRVGAPG
ncbi:MAG: phosphoribosylanthranilate isomerase [Pedosphaera sp.]|nr:phosphoribosylanthranilate isomerase [Pedosphaera sp.]